MSTPTYRSLSRRRYEAMHRLDLYIEDADPRTVVERQFGLCGLCFTPLHLAEYHLDHKRPVSAGGEHSYANLQAVHPECHYAKQQLDRLVVKRYRSWYDDHRSRLLVQLEIRSYLDQELQALRPDTPDTQMASVF